MTAKPLHEKLEAMRRDHGAIAADLFAQGNRFALARENAAEQQLIEAAEQSGQAGVAPMLERLGAKKHAELARLRTGGHAVAATIFEQTNKFELRQEAQRIHEFTEEEPPPTAA